MAGKQAGLVAATFPDMNGEWIPSTFFSIEPWWRDLVENPMSIHFLHRLFGATALLSAVGLAWWVHRRARTPVERSLAWLLAGLTLLQFALGALVVIWSRSPARSDRAPSLRLPHPLGCRHACTFATRLSVLNRVRRGRGRK